MNGHRLLERTPADTSVFFPSSALDAGWIQELMTEPDPRVRANAVESLWGVATEATRALFWTLVGDADNRVAGNALLGLYELGETSSIEPILEMAEHPRDLFRATAAWIMGRTEDPRFHSRLRGLLQDAAAGPRIAAQRALRALQNPEASAGSPLTLSACRLGRGAPGEFQVSVRLPQAHGPSLPVQHLRATKFAFWADGEPVLRYAVSEWPARELGAVVFVYAESGTAARETESVLRELERIKGSEERWQFIRYRRRTESLVSGVGDTLRQALQCFEQLRSSHVLLMLDQEETTEGLSQVESLRARFGSALHVIGDVLGSPTDVASGPIKEVLPALYSGLRHHYRVRFTVPSERLKALRIQVWTSESMGATTVPCGT